MIYFNNPLYPLVLVGENNVGKTNVFRALNLFFSNNARDLTIDYFNDKNNDIEIILQFSDLNDWEKENIGEKNLINDKLFVRQVGKNQLKDKLRYYALRAEDRKDSKGDRLNKELQEHKNMELP